MREILFRAKRFGDKKWVYGDLLKYQDGNMIIHYYNCGMRQAADVIPKTVCQYTGLTDKNGRKIFEGDILSHDGVGNIKVQFKNSEFLVHGITHNMFSTLLSSVYRGCEIIGNIFDNPELIREKD